MKNKGLIIILTSVLGVIFLIFTLYFITNYNTITVYSYSLNNDKFSLGEGIIIKSKIKNVMTINTLKTVNGDIKDYYVEYLIDNKLIVGGNNINLSSQKIIEDYGYEEYFNKETFDNILDKFIIRIYVPNDNTINCALDKDNCTKYEYRLYVYEEFNNKKLFNFKAKHI